MLPTSNHKEKLKDYLSKEIMGSIFHSRLIRHEFQSQPDFFKNSVNSSKYGLNSTRFFASNVWQMVPM